MSTWVIGDVHGCYKQLKRLYRRLDFSSKRDRLWLTGDLVNRGPQSVEVLRWCARKEAKLGDRFAAVLGNHDLHTLAVHHGVTEQRSADTLEPLLQADDRNELISWLTRLPFLVHRDDVTLVHAGLLPEWSVKKARRAASELHDKLTANPSKFLKGNGLKNRHRRALAAFTRLRTFDNKDRPSPYSGGLKGMPSKLTPWFRHPQRVSSGERVYCGHWAALGFHQEAGVTALDTGCVWAGALTALRIEDNRIVQEARP